MLKAVGSRLLGRFQNDSMLVDVKLLGRPLRIRPGAVRRQPDYDDAWLLALTWHARCIVDVGANVGQAALLIQQAPSAHSLVLVEANPDALVVAAENLIRNHLSEHVHFVAGFASVSEGEAITFWTVGTGAAGSRYAGHAVTAARQQSMVQIPTITLDGLCSRLALVPDLIKIDVEGAEHEVLSGSEKLTRRRETRFLVEMHAQPELSMRENARRVLVWCEQQRYSGWYLKEKRVVTNPEEIAHRGRCHLLLQPEEWELPIWLQDLPQGASLAQALQVVQQVPAPQS